MPFNYLKRLTKYSPPVPKLKGPNTLTVKLGETVNLSAEGSTDPGGNTLSYNWFYYGEAGSLAIATARTGNPLKIEDDDKVNASFTLTKCTKLGTMHIILAVTDNDIPAHTRYKRLIVNVIP